MLVVRRIVPIAAGLILLMVIWAWWLSTQMQRRSEPLPMLQTGLAILIGMLTTCAWLMTPALLAGTFTGERVHEALMLLLTCQVSVREIVLGRLIGRLSIGACFLLASLPALTLAAGLCDLPAADLGLAILLPLAAGFGAGGMCCAASVASRRGRDALLAVYLLDVLILLAPVFASLYSASIDSWVAPLNPYLTIIPLVEGEGRQECLMTVGAWTAIGLAGAMFTAWRLRPLATSGFNESGTTGKRRSGRVPAVGKRPMVWKEMHIERMRRAHRIVRWLGLFVVVLYLGMHLALGLSIVILADFLVLNNVLARTFGWWRDLCVLAQSQYGTIAKTGVVMTWLLELAVGLRAASTISSERERNTWDSILISPLEGGEIVWAKLIGSLYALRWLAIAVAIGWIMPLAAGVAEIGSLVEEVLITTVVCAFMATLGLYLSLTNASATKAMSLTVGGWIVFQALVNLTSMIASAIIALLSGIAFAWWFNTPAFFRGTGAKFWSDAWWANLVLHPGIYLVLTLSLAAYCHLRFDQLAGRTFAPRIQMSRRAKTAAAIRKPTTHAVPEKLLAGEIVDDHLADPVTDLGVQRAAVMPPDAPPS